MKQAFTNIKVRPIYGQYRAQISWTADSELAGGHFTVLKSPDGINDWRHVASGDMIDAAVDGSLMSQGRMLENYYKVVVDKGGKTFESPIVGTFGTHNRTDFGMARSIMEHEYLGLRDHIPVLVYKVKVYAPPCPVCVDEETGQAIGVSLCTRCWGTAKDGGYFPPVSSFMKITHMSSRAQIDSKDATGTSDPMDMRVRILVFPLLRKNDLLVHKEADRRYLVDDVQYMYLGGKVPVAAMANLTLLRTSDIRYQL